MTIKRWAPYLVLLAEVALFYRPILTGEKVIPWDIRNYHLPQALFVAKAIHDGELPLWTPDIYCGHPFSSNIQTALYYPPRFIATILGGVKSTRMLYSLEVELILHVFLAGIFCFLLLREFDIGAVPALAGATSFQLGSFFASQAEHLGSIEGAAWLPLIWLLVYRQRQRLQLRSALLLSAAIAMTILCGFMPLTTVAFLSTGFLVILLIAFRQAKLHLAATLAGCFAASLLLSAVAFFPGWQLARLSVSRFRTDWMGNGGGLPLRSLISLVWPESFANHGAADITVMYLYSGVVMLLGLIALAVRRKGLLFALLLVISTLFMLGESTPFGSLYVHIVPAAIRAAIYPQEWIAPFALSFCILGTMGLARFPRFAAPAILIAACDLIWFGSNRPFNSITKAADPGVSETAMLGSPELLNTVRYLTHTTNPPSRIDTINGPLDWAAGAMTTEIPDANGSDPMALIRYNEVRRAFAQGERWGYYYQVTDPSSPLLPMWNICCLLTRTQLQSPPAQYPNVSQVPGGYLYYTNHPAPRFHLEPQGSVKVETYRRNSVQLETNSDASAHLITSEANYPGWHATIDGRDTPMHETNNLFRALDVPAGKHHIDFHYSPTLLFLSAAISATAWIAWMILLAPRLRYPNRYERR